MLSIRTKLCLNTHQAQFRRTSTLNLCTNLKEITLCTPYQIIIHVPEDSWNVEGEGWAFVDLHEPEAGPGCSSRHWAWLATNHSRWLKVIFTFFKKILSFVFLFLRTPGVKFINCFVPWEAFYRRIEQRDRAISMICAKALGQFNKGKEFVLHLRPTFTLQKASQKLGVVRERLALDAKQLMKLNPWESIF